MRRNMLGKQKQFVNHIVKLMKEVSQFSGNRNRKVSHVKCHVHVVRHSSVMVSMLKSRLSWSASCNRVLILGKTHYLARSWSPTAHTLVLPCSQHSIRHWRNHCLQGRGLLFSQFFCSPRTVSGYEKLVGSLQKCSRGVVTTPPKGKL